MTYTPMIQQYLDIKEEYPDCILFFRLGDFYEMFFDDAETASRALEIALTERDCGNNEKCAMCGVPYHVKDLYIEKLINQGYKVAICEQLEDPAQAKGLVERGVIEVITPGTFIENEIQKKDANFLLSIYQETSGLGLASLDLSTGKLFITESFDSEQKVTITNEISRIAPSEILLPKDQSEHFGDFEARGYTISPIENVSNPQEMVTNRLDASLGELESKRYMIQALANLLNYIYRFREENFEHIKEYHFYEIHDYLEIDSYSLTNLEIMKNLYTNNKKGSLFGILDNTQTSMGSRLLKSFLERPLLNKEKILSRQGKIAYFFEHLDVLLELKGLLNKIYDLERILGKCSYGKANGRDLIALKNSLKDLPLIKEILSKTNNNLLQEISNLDPLDDIYHLINSAIVDDPPILITEGGLIKEGFHKDLDEIRSNKILGQKKLIEYEEDQREATGIKNLKIVFNKKLGYFIDVTKANLSKVPDSYEKRQTLTNSDRFKTEALVEIEHLILSSETEIFNKEYEVFQSIRNIILNELSRIQKTAEIIAHLDVYTALAKFAYDNEYTRPQLNQQGLIDVTGARHPIIEDSIGRENFIGNSIQIGQGKDNIQIITGPNMSGKSTYLRQAAILSILAQVGSFVPADSANISIVDKIFTRIGASDNLYQGESTFMVEMNEMSHIIKHATPNSLLILDEVGRGTSTYDGLSIAWAIIEYISKQIKAKTLFATHYHELTILEDRLDNVINMKVLIEEHNKSILFMHKIVRGFSDKSYGIEVAKLAGLPDTVTRRAQRILETIEGDRTGGTLDQIDLSILEQEDNFTSQASSNYEIYGAFIDRLKLINTDHLSPIQALTTLDEIVREASSLEKGELD